MDTHNIGNREIKFRFWGSGTAEMLLWEDLEQPATIPFMLEPTKKWKVMQYTGLKDKNGKEIYEGDILKKGTNTYVVEEISEMFMSLGTLDNKKNRQISDYGQTKATFSEQWEVIGNIFENPELLNK